jgi:hypothetical protein
VFDKLDESGWPKDGARDLIGKARKIPETRPGGYEPPDMDPGLVKDLASLIEQLKQCL